MNRHEDELVGIRSDRVRGTEEWLCRGVYALVRSTVDPVVVAAVDARGYFSLEDLRRCPALLEGARKGIDWLQT